MNVSNNNQSKQAGPVFGQPSYDDHEEVVFCSDKDTGLKAIIGIHNTVLGPSLGGTRMWNYDSEWDALNDVLRLSRGMTFKSAISGLDLGGGKAVIIGDAKTQKTPELMRGFAKFIDSLGGRYITAEDVGMETADMNTMREVTPHVVGVSEDKGGSGNPSPVTAYGVFMGMKAAAEYKFGTTSLTGKKILVEGVGHVGEALIKLIAEEGGKVVITDIDQERLEKIHKEYGSIIYEGENHYAADVDIYAPCALGATINDDSLNVLKAEVIAGSANNQLENEKEHGKKLQEKGIVYAPDFLINAGGIINVYGELKDYDRQETMRQTENIFHTTMEVLKSADKEGMTTNQAALKIAQARIDERRKEKTIK